MSLLFVVEMAEITSGHLLHSSTSRNQYLARLSPNFERLCSVSRQITVVSGPDGKLVYEVD